MKIDPEFKSLIPSLTEEELTQLDASLLADGCRDPIVVWDEKDILLDGHNRYAICEANGIGYRAYRMSMPSRDAAKSWIIRNQFGRRNLTLYQRAKLALKLKPLIAAKAKQGKRSDLSPNSAKSQPHDTREELAAVAGVSHDTIAKVEYIEANADEDAKAKAEMGEISVNAAYREAQPAHVSHNSGENEWYTPSEYIDAVIKVMGGIDCDPASSAKANETVGAKQFYTTEDDGLQQKWGERVYLNPPYANPLIAEFTEQLCLQLSFGGVKQAIVLVNNATDTKWFHGMMLWASAICLVRKRVRFLDPQGKPGSPLQGQVFVYFGKNKGDFRAEFKQFGAICYVIR